MLRVDVRYLDEPSHSVRLTLAEKHRRTRACGVLVKSFLKSFREKHGAHLDDAAPRLALRRARDGAILDRDALIGDALEDGDVVVLEPSSARPEEPPPPSSLRCVLRARADAEIRALELVARAPPSGHRQLAFEKAHLVIRTAAGSSSAKTRCGLPHATLRCGAAPHLLWAVAGGDERQHRAGAAGAILAAAGAMPARTEAKIGGFRCAGARETDADIGVDRVP